jgi:hypothetical protein
VTGSTPHDPPRLPAGVEEALELLLPDADEQHRDEAERVAGFFRLLQADACRVGEGVTVDLARARDDLARSGRDRLEDSLHDLCAHHLAALVDPGRFLHPGTAQRSAAEAWRELENLRDEYDGLAELPAPGEPLEAVAARLIESLARHSGDAAAGLWHARLVAALRGPRAGESAFRALSSAAEDVEPPAAVWAGVIECALDRGAVHPAADLAEECVARHPGDERLSRLAVWCRLLSGDVAGARALDAQVGAWKGALPGALLRLRTELPDCLAVLAGRTPRAADRVSSRREPDVDALLDRASFGAQLVAVVLLHPDTGAELVDFDAAAALRPRVVRWFEDREHAALRPGTPEHRVLRDARALAWHREGRSALPDSLGGADSRAALLQPILDDAGETCGLLRIECSHHLLPTPARAEALARAWRRELLRRRGRWERTETARVWSVAPDDRSAVARVFEDLVQRLGIKTSRRAWWGFELQSGVAQLVARGGDGLGPIDEAPGHGRALRRALACGGPVRGEDPDPGLYLHAQSAAGAVLCLRLGDQCVGALAIESERRRDFSAAEVERLAGLANEGALHLRLAQFHGEHTRRFERSVFADADSPGFRRFHLALRRSQASPAPLVIHGPAGSGKRVFARWAWFERNPELPPQLESTVAGWLRDGATGSAYLTGLDDLDSTGQHGLLRALENGSVPEGVAFGMRRDPATAAREGRLCPELAAVLGREPLRVPGFADRREELTHLIAQRAHELARLLGRPLPQLDDSARAFCWRQAWPGNWRELDARLHALLRRTEDGPVGADELALLWRETGDEPILRLDSRKPPGALLRCALLSTATAGGRANKRKAALYLGWDPDTLAARLAEAEITDLDLAQRGLAWCGGREGP